LAGDWCIVTISRNTFVFVVGLFCFLVLCVTFWLSQCAPCVA
jgi:hypothetical protein